MVGYGILITISSAFLCATCVILGVLVAKNAAARIHKVWAAFNFTIAAWGAGIFVASVTSDASLAFDAWRAAHLGGLFIPVLFYDFVCGYSGRKKGVLGIFFYSQAAVFAALTVMGQTGYRVQTTFDTGFYIIAEGFLYKAVTVLWFLPVVIGFVLMLRHLQKCSGVEKPRAKFLLGAMLIGFLGGPQHFFPAYGISFNPFMGNFLIGAYTLIASYAIFKHKLLDIDVVVKRAAVFAGLFAFLFGVFALFLSLGQQYFVDRFGWPKWTAMVPSILIIMFTIRPLENWLVNVTDKYLFQKKYDYRQLMRLFTTEVLMIFDLDQVTLHTVQSLDNIIKLESCAVILSEDGEKFRIAAARGIEDTSVLFRAQDPIVYFLRDAGEPLVLEKLLKRPGAPDELLKAFKQLKSRICFPIMFNKEFLGFLSLGAKKSGDEYTAEDIDVLGSLARAEAIAIKNARSNADLVKAKARQHLGDMADGMSHQFNNRFGTIVALLEFQEILIPETLAEVGALPAEEQSKRLKGALEQTLKSIAEARDSAFRGGEIAKTLLVHTRPDRIGFGMYDVSKGIPLGLNLIALKHADFKTIIIIPKVDEYLPPTWSSLSIIQEILLITLDNAYDAIKTKQQKIQGFEGVIEIFMSYRPSENIIRMTIKDNGCGIKPEDLETVNAGVPYFTTKGSASQKSGYGAGVHTLGEYVSILDGRHRYESQHGEWTSCIIDLPVRQKPEAAEGKRDDKNSNSR